MASSKMPSNRSFGLTFAVILALGAAYSFYQGGTYSFWLSGAAGFFLLSAFAFPEILSPLNKAWHFLGLALNRIVTPIVLSFLFLLFFTPYGMIYRLFGADPLRLKKPDLPSYWLPREEAVTAESMKRQF